MELIKIDDKNIAADYFSSLIKDIYKEWPYIIDEKINEFYKNTDRNNPFYVFGKCDNLFLFDDSSVVGHISLIQDNRLPESGIVGYFECFNNYVYAEELFKSAKKYFLEDKKKNIIGPIDLSVWNNFRLSCSEELKPFYKEPFYRDYYQLFFEKFGFSIIQKNYTICKDSEDPAFSFFERDFKRLSQEGFSFLKVNKKDFNKISSTVYSLIANEFLELQAFSKASIDEFLYFFDYFPEESIIFYCNDKFNNFSGFCFAYPDSNTEKMMILKLILIDIKFRDKGIGSALLYFIYKDSIDKHFKNFVFSTMKQEILEIKKFVPKEGIYFKEYKLYELILC
jgi:hypothetical protein